MSDAYQGLISKGQSLQSSGTYQPYTGGFTSDQQTAFNTINGLNGAAQPYFTAANQNYTNGVVPAYANVSAYESPYNQAVIDATQQQFNLQNAQQQQGVVGDAIAKGAYGGNRVGVAQAQLAGQQQTAQAPVIAGLYNSNYAQALQAAQQQQQTDLAAAGGLGNLGSTATSTGLSQAAAQLGAGTQQQQFDYQQYLNQQSYPYQQLSWLSGLINGTNNVGSTSTTTQPGGNIFSELLGLGVAGASLFNKGGRVNRDAGGVIPYGLQSPFMQGDSSWGSYLANASDAGPYANDNAIYLPYIPTTKARAGSRYLPDAPAPANDNSDDDLTSYLKELENINSLKGRASGGVVPMRRRYASGGQSIGDIYGGILQYNPANGTYGGVYQGAGPAVMLPASTGGSGGVAPTSYAAPSGGSTYDVGYDPSYPISSAFNGGWGSGATGSVGLGLTPDSNGSGRMPTYTSSPTVEAYTYDNGQMNPLNGNSATRAIAANTNTIPTGDNTDGLTWNNATPVTSYAGGDPWAGQRIGGNDYGSTDPGLYTGNAQSIGNNGKKIGLFGQMLGLNGGNTGLDRLFGLNGGSGVFGGGTLLGGFLGGLGDGSGGVSAAPAGTNFLNARGVNTSNLTAGQVQNNLEAQLGGSSHRGSFGVATGGRIGYASGGDPTEDNPFDSVNPDDSFDPTQYGNAQGVVPYTTGAQFMTDPQPGYSQNIGDALTSLTEGKGLNLSPDVRQSLLAAGAGMMASKAPFALQGIGQGVLAGVDTWNQRQALERENAKARADISQSGQDVATRAAQTAANIGLTGAQTGATRYTFIRTPAGVMVTDAQNPSAPPQFTAWGGVLPGGGRAPASPQDAAAQGIPDAASGTLFNVQPKQVMDPRLMSPDVAPVVLTETTQKNTAAYDQYKQSAAANEQLGELEHSLSQLPDTGWLTQGPGFDQRLDIAKNINTISSIAGGQPIIPTDEVAAGEDANKVTTRLGYNLSQTLGSGEAASIVMQSINAVPGAYNSRAGAERLIGAIRAVNQRNMDYYNGLQQWEATNNGSTYGYDQYFNQNNPPELYALSAYVPKQAMMMLKSNPKLAPYFDQKYGYGHNVSQYVLGGQ